MRNIIFNSMCGGIERHKTPETPKDARPLRKNCRLSANRSEMRSRNGDWPNYSKLAIQFPRGFRSSSSSASFRASLSNSMACRSRSFASSMRPATLE
jgi:hypothetical protein